jgi:hypothetical protein
LGVIYQIRAPYITGYIDHQAFKGWYNWHLDDIKFNIDEFIKFLKNSGNCCLMCMEEYARPTASQKHYCHRELLVDIILNNKSNDPLLIFDNRVDL